MSYCIQYDSVPVKHKTRKNRLSGKKFVAFALVLGIMAALFVPQLRLGAMKLLFPGFHGDAMDALDAFARQLCQGVSLADAFHSFCLQTFAPLNG